MNCGQCASVCPTGALTIKSEVDRCGICWPIKKKKVIVQIAPAVRVGLGECFGLKPGEITTGRIVAALKHLGFDQIYDTSFAADLTVIEEGTEFLERKAQGGTLPMFTSCCPGWVKYAEQYFPGVAAEPFHMPLAAGNVRLAGQGDASRSAQDRAQGI